jgi:hypothetical protein
VFGVKLARGLEIRAREAARKLGEGPTVVRSSAQLEEIGDVLLKV